MACQIPSTVYNVYATLKHVRIIWVYRRAKPLFRHNAYAVKTIIACLPEAF